MPPRKRSGDPTKGGPAKKKQAPTRFKMRPIDMPTPSNSQGAGPVPASSTSNPVPTLTTVNTRSYQIYDLANGRLGMRHQDNKVNVPAAQPVSSQADSTENHGAQAMSGFGDEVDAIMAEYTPEEPPVEHQIKKKRARPELRAAAKVREWLPLRENFLEELLRFYGGEYNMADPNTACATCGSVVASNNLLRCTACVTRSVHCKACVLTAHARLPLHVMEIWNGKMWTKISLRDLGHVVQLGHDGGVCPHPAQGTRRIVVGHVDGVHQVEVAFCECLDEANTAFTKQWIQLFRQGWFPATTNRPATAFTFVMLNTFQELNLQSKTSLYDYWRTLERITDNTATGVSLDRYKQVSHVIRLWRHLTALKRAARCHDPAGAAGTVEGELALDCPACPHPEKNIPDDWESAPPEIKWIYTLFLMLDANFRAKLKDRGLEDVELGSGWSYYVENSKFKTHVASIGNQADKSNCSAEHKAIQNANLRRQGYIASGVGAVLCARHAMVRKTGVGDLPNGEKFLIMDYLLFCTVLGVILMLLISYDIACQWHKKLATRALEGLPPHIATDISERVIRYAIPKKHIRVHGPNHSRFSFNYLRWVGRTYGEGIEAHWAHMNPVALSAREMAPGMRREHMNDHWAGWNWQKTIGFASHLLKLLTEADRMHAKQHAAHITFSATFKPEDVERWDAEVRAWQENPRECDDPYEETRSTTTIRSTRLEIADEEARELAAGTLPPHDVSPGIFLQVGLEIEETQRSLKRRDKTASGTNSTLAELQEKRTALNRRIDTWQGLQDLHMPIVMQFRNSGDPSFLATTLQRAAALNPRAPTATGPHATVSSGTPANSSSTASAPRSSLPTALGSESSAVPATSSTSAAPAMLFEPGPPTAASDDHSRKAEDIVLWLPSTLPAILRTSLAPGLVDKERRLRIAQADDALEDIRRLRRILTGITDFKRFNVSGTGQRTSGKVRSLYNKFQDKVTRAAERYRAARAALVNLDRGGDWEGRFKELADGDIRGPGRDEDDDTSEGRYEISWIWLVPRGSGFTLPDGVQGELDPNEFLANVKVEWARSQARAERWREEVVLLQEEMRRVIVYFWWKARWWCEQGRQRLEAAQPLRQGLSAYAEYQASVYDRLAQHCAETWVPYLRTRDGLMPEWASDFIIPMKAGGSGAGVSAHAALPANARAGTSVSTALPGDVSSGSDTESEDHREDSLFY